MRLHFLLPLIGCALLFGCGGSSGGPGAPAPTPPATASLPDSARNGTALVAVDTQTGKVAVTPLGGGGGSRARSTIYAGSAISVETTDALVDEGSVGRRIVNLRLRNNTVESIGARNGYRVILDNLAATDASSGAGLESLFSIQTVAGTGVAGSADGATATATVTPTCVAAGRTGTLLIGTPTNLRIRQNEVISTLRSVSGGVGGVLYFADASRGTEYAIYTERSGHVVRLLNLKTSGLSTFAGTGVAGDAIGTPAATQFNNPMGICFEAPVTGTTGAILVCDRVNGKLKRIAFNVVNGVPSATGVTLRFSGLNQPTGVSVSRKGSIAITETGIHRLRIYPDGGSNLVQLGSGGTGLGAGLASTAALGTPAGVTFVNEVAYVTHTTHARVTAVLPITGANPLNAANWYFSNVAGSAAGFTDGPATGARFQTGIESISADDDRLYLPDPGNHRVRSIVANGSFETVGSVGGAEFGSLVQLSNPTGHIDGIFGPTKIPFIKQGTPLSPGAWSSTIPLRFMVDAGVRRFQFVVTLEADAEDNTPPDGNASNPNEGSDDSHLRVLIRGFILEAEGIRGNASLDDIRDVTSDGQGNLYFVADRTVWRYDARAETFHVIAGQSNTGSTDGIGTTATFTDLRAIAVDSTGNRVYVAEANCIRVLEYFGFGDRMSPSSYSVTTVVGDFATPGVTVGVGRSARLRDVSDLAIDQAGRAMYVALDSSTVYMVRFSGGPASDPLQYQFRAEFAGIDGLRIRTLDLDHKNRLMTSSGTDRLLYVIDRTNYTYVLAAEIGPLTNGLNGRSPNITAPAMDTLGNVYYVSTDVTAHAVRRAGANFFHSTVMRSSELTSYGRPLKGCVLPSGEYVLVTDNGIVAIQRVIRR
ncbi:MAG: hypothetical protein SFX74_09195 [Fimbriimonadaceae bacterium]|nr:hypothetical protein [Fimbriimonadaceae bacterium]